MNEHGTPDLPERGHQPAPTVPPGGVGGDLSQLARVLECYLADLAAGRQPDRERILAEHGQLAAQLDDALAGLDFIHGAGIGSPSAREQLGDFRILREVGRGGMGVVYEAEQISLKRRVALKVLGAGALVGDLATQRFQREAETVARLHHTNIVPIHAVGCEQGVHYYAMQFIDGLNLADLAQTSLEEGRAITAAEVAQWGLQAAEAIAHAHARGVIHRDIKPSNLILDSDGRIWLTDFGLARRAEDVTLSVTGALLGTPRYMSPEQAGLAVRPIDHRTDIYSLGATLYELVTGCPIFAANTPQAVLNQILHQEPVPPRRINPHVPRDLETILLTCVAKEPAHRYASAQVLAEDLRAVIEGRSIQARRPSLAVRALRWGRKHRRTSTVAVVSAAASLLLLGAALWGLDAYHSVRQPQVMLTTRDALVEAVILTADGHDIERGPFSLPTRQGVTVDAGEHRLRVSAPGRLSDCYLLDLSPRERLQVNLSVADRLLGPGLSGDHYDTCVWVELAGKADFVVARPGAMRRVDPITGATVWQAELRSAEYARQLPGDIDRAAWDEFFQRWDDRSAQLMLPAPDLDGDGVGDLVWSSGRVAALMAISGGDGRLLWWHFGSDSADASGLEPDAQGTAGTGFVTGCVTLPDTDDDGVVDLAVMMASTWGNTWMQAISGRTGESLWQRALEPDWFRPPSWSNRVQYFAPVLAACADRSWLALAAGTRLLVLDSKDGSVRNVEDLRGTAVQSLRVADLTGDGTHEVLLLVERGPQQLFLMAFGREPCRRLWEWPVDATFEPYAAAGELAWPLVADLDRDGSAEIVVPSRRSTGSDEAAGERQFGDGLEVRSGRDGKILWRRQLATGRTPHIMGPVEQFIVGPDLDGDGWDELYVASLHRRSFGPGDATLYVDALSGRDGRSIWYWSLPQRETNDRVASLAWWPSGVEGQPYLAVCVARWPKQPDGVYMLESTSGRLLHAISGASEVQIADGNADGLPDLAFGWSSSMSRHPGQTDMRVLRGAPPRAWARLTAARRVCGATTDVDRDGVEDLLLIDPLEAVSGATGQRLWRSRVSSSGCTALTSSHGDLDGDGVPDLLAFPAHTSVTPGTLPVLQAVSARSGDLMWASDVRVRSLGAVYAVVCEDLDADGQAELVLVVGLGAEPEPHVGSAIRPPGLRLTLIVMDADSGKERWRQSLSDPLDAVDQQLALAPVLLTSPEPGVNVIVIPAWDSAHGWEIRAYRASDGALLWQQTVSGGAERDRHRMARTVPTVSACDLDRDAIMEVWWVEYSPRAGEDGKAPGFTATLRVVEGITGGPRWQWTWVEQIDEHRPVPQLADFAGDGQYRICVPQGRLDDAEWVVLDAAGGETCRVRATFADWPVTARVADINGDGGQELLWVTFDGHLIAMGSDLQQTLWRVPARELAEIRPSASGRSALILVRREDGVWGMDGVTGLPRWRSACGHDRDRISLLLWGRDCELPRVVTTGPMSEADSTFDSGGLECFLTLPVAVDGTYRSRARGDSVVERPVRRRDPRLARPLPWNIMETSFSARSAGGISDFCRHVLVEGAVVMLCLVVPGWLACGVWRRWSWRVGWFAVLLALLCAAGVWGALLRPGHLPNGYWLVIAQRALLALPLGVWTLRVIHCLANRRWTQATGLLLAAVGAGAMLAAGWLAWDGRAIDADGYHDSAGWYWAILPGAYLTGCLTMGQMVARRAVPFCRHLRGMASGGRAQGRPGAA